MMTGGTMPFDMSKELATLQHEKRNQSLRKLPANASIQRRPLSHPAIAPPQVGSHVQKVVYVSCRTPVISAVKRVKKLLQHVEKRALQGIETKNAKKTQLRSNLLDLSDKLAKDSEEILVKASGRAMEQALRVGEWFRTKETEFMCNVDIRTGSVAAIDDLLTSNDSSSDQLAGDNHMQPLSDQDHTKEPEESSLEGGDTTLDILGNKPATAPEQSLTDIQKATNEGGEFSTSQQGAPQKTRKRRKKRKREAYDENDMPEARIRWVKTVEVAISLKA